MIKYLLHMLSHYLHMCSTFGAKFTRLSDVKRHQIIHYKSSADLIGHNTEAWQEVLSTVCYAGSGV